MSILSPLPRLWNWLKYSSGTSRGTAGLAMGKRAQAHA